MKLKSFNIYKNILLIIPYQYGKFFGVLFPLFSSGEHSCKYFLSIFLSSTIIFQALKTKLFKDYYVSISAFYYLKYYYKITIFFLILIISLIQIHKFYNDVRRILYKFVTNIFFNCFSLNILLSKFKIVYLIYSYFFIILIYLLLLWYFLFVISKI